MINRASLTELSKGLLCNIIMLFMVLWLELVNFSPRDSDSDSRHKSLDSDSKPAGLGLESYASGLGLGLETCGLGLDSDSRKRGLVASLVRGNIMFIKCCYSKSAVNT